MYKLDLRHSITPFSLLEICNTMKRMRVGDLLEVFGDEPAIQRDLEKIVPEGCYETVEMDDLDDNNGEYRMVLKKKNPTKKGETKCPKKI